MKNDMTVTSFLQTGTYLDISWQKLPPCRNQSTDLQIKPIDWFLYDIDLRHERVKTGNI